MNASYADEQGDWKRKGKRGEKREELEQHKGKVGKLQCYLLRILSTLKEECMSSE